MTRNDDKHPRVREFDDVEDGLRRAGGQQRVNPEPLRTADPGEPLPQPPRLDDFLDLSVVSPWWAHDPVDVPEHITRGTQLFGYLLGREISRLNRIRVDRSDLRHMFRRERAKHRLRAMAPPRIILGGSRTDTEFDRRPMFVERFPEPTWRERRRARKASR